MSAGYTIRTASTEDLATVERTLAAADLPLDGVREQFGEGYAIAESEGRVIGVEGIEVYGNDGLLRSAAVVEAWRGRGVGDALTRDRIAWARQRGLRAIYLLTTTAGSYFPRFGFAPAARDAAPDGVRRSREFAEACPASALFMCLSLDGDETQ